MRISATLFLLLLLLPQAAALPVQLSVSMPESLPEAMQPRTLKLTATRQDSGTTEGERKPFTVELEPFSRRAVGLEPGIWRLALEAEGFWAKPLLVTVAGDDDEAAFDLWPTGTVEGRLEVPRGEPVPESLRASFELVSEKGIPEAGIEGSTTCPVRAGQWSCPLPAARLDLRLQADGYVGHYAWGIQVPTGGVADLGTLDLRRGASVVGWVVTESEPSAEGARVRLSPRSAARQQSRLADSRAGRTGWVAEVNDRGFFQIGAVPPGEYVIEATKPPFAPARASVRVAEDRTTQVADPPLVLRRPRTVEVYVEPPVSPRGEPWWLEAVQVDGNSQAIGVFESRRIGANGSWNHDRVPQGRYEVRIGAHEDEWWFREELEIDAIPKPIFVHMPVIEVRGTVRLGEEPLPATLKFGLIPLASDAEGRFEGFLPHDGSWDVEVASTEARIERRLQLEVFEKPGKPYAEIEIRVPETTLAGWVVDENGQPVADAIVTAQSLDEIVPPVEIRTGEDGVFETQGLPAGLAVVSAQDYGRYSPELEVDLEDGGATEWVELTLRPELRIRGRVVAGGRGVPGARIKAEPAHVRGLPVVVRSSDVDGRFEVGLPPDTEQVYVSVGAPGFGFRFFSTRADPDRPLEIPVSDASGTIVVELPESFERNVWDSPKAFLLHAGAAEGLSYLRSWARFHRQPNGAGGRVVLPGMEPGDYSVCLLRYTERQSMAGRGDLGPACVGGSLSGFGELRLAFNDPDRN